MDHNSTSKIEGHTTTPPFYPTNIVSIFHLIISLMTEINMDWVFDPPHHGKGPCDAMSAVIKRTASTYILRGGSSILILLIKLQMVHTLTITWN
jgi:hypothetical protein